LNAGALLAGHALAKGSYQAIWSGPGPDAQVQILQKGNVVATVAAHVATLLDKSPQSRVDTTAGASPVVLAMQFKGKSFALTFAPGSPPGVSQASAQGPPPDQQ
jgi:phage tail sheath gpL-like